MALNWYIDAWAPTDGLVFASQRGQADDPWVLDAAGPLMTFAIAAPSFEAQPVDRSLAFGAVRRGFQERFSIDGEVEFSFESLAQLITFTRRIYSGSGPGTMGGGAGGPPPEPAPEGEGGAPDWLAGQRQERQGEGQNLAGRDLLGALVVANADRRQVVKGSITLPDVTGAASRLLIECAGAAAASGLRKDSSRLVHAAACLTTSVDELRDLYSFASERAPRIAEFLDRVYEWHRYRGSMYLEAWHPHLGDAAQAPIAAGLVRALGLPGSVRTLLDVVSYIAADRDFVVRSSQADLLPLLLAVAANFRAHAAGFVWFDARTDTQSTDRLLDDCSRFIADWLPIEKLPDKLEEEIRAWCWRGPGGQRS
ncbi:MAG: hypothetical protein ABIR56_07150 [Polaromonas sp.]